MAYPESLQGKTVLIIGGAGAIGGAAARMFAAGGARVVITYRGPEEVAAAQSAGAIPVTLGKNLLRSETAGIVATALVAQELLQ